MTTTGQSRRVFLQATGMAAAGTVLAAPTTGYAGRRRVCRCSCPARVRKDINSLDPNSAEVWALRAGVKCMKRLSNTDPRSWFAQAKIHLDACPHGNWFFLPWHRAYLHYFERVCRWASGWQGFNLPYWNWTKDPQVPAIFWDMSSPLFDNTRTAGPADTANPAAVGQPVIDSILAIAPADFIPTFASEVAVNQRDATGYGMLEGTPHNHIHVFVGGNMVTFWSPLDPIFWLHHANVDRIWAEWNEINPNGNSTDPNWLNFQFNDFVDECACPRPIRVHQTLSTYCMGYRYDTQAAVATRLAPVAKTRRSSFSSESEVARAATLDEPAAISLSLNEGLGGHLDASMKADGPGPSFRLEIRGVEAPHDPNTAILVFINATEIPDDPSTSPNFAGSFSFFGVDHGDHAEHGLTYHIDVTSTIRRLAAGQLDKSQPLNVKLVAHRLGVKSRGSEVRARSVRIVSSGH